MSGARINTTLASREYPLHTVHSHTEQPGSNLAESVRCSSSSQVVSMKLVFHSAYPDSSIADAVMKTFILFRLSVASCSNRSTTLERECIRMVWTREESTVDTQFTDGTRHISHNKLTVPSLMKGFATWAIFCLELATVWRNMLPVRRHVIWQSQVSINYSWKLPLSIRSLFNSSKFYEDKREGTNELPILRPIESKWKILPSSSPPSSPSVPGRWEWWIEGRAHSQRTQRQWRSLPLSGPLSHAWCHPAVQQLCQLGSTKMMCFISQTIAHVSLASEVCRKWVQ